MIRSMTGFGRSEFVENGTRVTVEVSSVNSRFFDLKAKLPRALAEYEDRLRKIVQEYVERGRVNVTVSVCEPGERARQMAIDTTVADRYAAMAGELAERYGIESGLDGRTLLGMPEVITWREESSDTGELWAKAEQALRPALDAHHQMRETEGAAMGDDFDRRLAILGETITEIRRLAPEVATANAERLRAKIESLIGADTFDEQRFAMEIAIYADKVDITEECVRFASHCDQFAAELAADKASGRKLSFLLQEMNREANTIGSKITDAGIAQTVVRIKEELEKMREQAENME